MIKKLILGLGLFMFGSLGFSNALFQYFPVGLEKTPSYWENQYDVGILKKGRFLTNYLGTSKALLGLSQNYFTFWNDGGLYLFYSGSSTFGRLQGYFQYYMACDEILYDSTGDALVGCSSPQLFDYKNDLVSSNFISSLNNGDIVYIEDNISHNLCGGYCTYYRYSIKACFSSSSVGSTLCFVADKSTYESNSSYKSHNPLFYDSLLSGNSNFSNINSSLLSDPPGFINNIEGGSSIGNNVSMTGNLMYNNSCTNGYVVSKVSSWYGGINNICYAGTYNTGIINDWVAYSSIDTGLSYRDLYKFVSNGSFGYYSSYSDWFNSWANAMKRYKLGQIQFDIFNGQPVALYSYFNRLYDSAGIDGSVSVDAYNVVNFCNLALYSDYNEPYNGNYFSDVCSSFNSSSDSPVVTTGDIGNIDDEEILPPGFDTTPPFNVTSSGTIVSVDWSGTLSGNTNQNFDGKNFINDFYQKLQSVFQKPINSATGIIPGYILVFLVAIILFRFIQH